MAAGNYQCDYIPGIQVCQGVNTITPSPEKMEKRAHLHRKRHNWYDCSDLAVSKFSVQLLYVDIVEVIGSSPTNPT